MLKIVNVTSFLSRIALSKVHNPQYQCQLKQVRFKRTVFHRTPIKILTDDGKDYYEEYGTTERVSSQKNQVNRKEMAKYERIQDYYDEGFLQEDLHQINNQRNKKKKNQMKNETTDKNKDKNKTKQEFKQDKEKVKSEQKSTKSKKDNFEHQVVLKPRLPGIPFYKKLGENNKELLTMITKLKSRNQREKTGFIILEGKRLISDAIKVGLKLNTIFFSLEENLVGIPDLEKLAEKGVQLKKVFYEDLKHFSEMCTSPGIMGVFERPSNQDIANSPFCFKENKLPVTLICDNIRDPGNLGSIIRTSAAVGIEKIICVKGCVDPWETKVLRSGAGAHFRLPIIYNVDWPFIFNHIPFDKSIDVFIADHHVDEDELIKQNNQIQQLRKPLQFNQVLNEETNELMIHEDSYKDEGNLLKYRNANIFTSLYMNVAFFRESIDKPTAFIVGGETKGLSNQAYKLAYDLVGTRLKIPLSSGMDSLNSSIAASIILYEMKRQFIVQQTSKSIEKSQL